jgi:hypothetical protein
VSATYGINKYTNKSRARAFTFLPIVREDLFEYLALINGKFLIK